MEFEFLKLVTEIKKKRTFDVIHGPVLRSGNTATDIGRPSVDPMLNKDPLLILREHIVVNDTRIFDILKRYDDAETYSVEPQQFASALQVNMRQYVDKMSIKCSCLKKIIIQFISHSKRTKSSKELVRTVNKR